MQKIRVIGSSGAGKSVFASRLAERTGLPLIQILRSSAETDEFLRSIPQNS